MKLTIIFGNGFDKNLGLNTTYKDFYKWLDENQKKESDEIYCNIKEMPENWSDLELALGKYTFDNEIIPDKFLKQSGLSSDDQKLISKQIFPLYGNEFFNIEEAQKNQ